MINRITLLLFIPCILLLITCTEDAADPQSDVVPIDLPSYYGTYLYNDDDCSGSDIQYATISDNGITFFDFLGDNCDDTVSCYAQDSYELTEVTTDTFLIVSQDGSYITGGELYLNADSSITLSYEDNNGPVEYSWEKIKDDIYTFTPLCDQEYENTKDIVDIIVYAVSDNGDLLWETYVHQGIWDLGFSVVTTDDNGYIIMGKLDAIYQSGGFYTFDSDTRDLIKLNSLGDKEWEKEITYSNYGVSDNYLSLHTAKNIVKTSQNNIFFTAPHGSRLGSNLVLMNQQGDLIWSKYEDSIVSAVTENFSGKLVSLSRSDSSLVLKVLENTTGDIISEKEYLGLYYPIATLSNAQGMVITGFIKKPDSLNYSPTYLLKTDDEGQEEWRKIWDQEAEWIMPHDLIETNDGGFLIFTSTGSPSYATLIKTDDEGQEEWRKIYDDYKCCDKGWIHPTEDGGIFMASSYVVKKLNANFEVEWNAGSGPPSFTKLFNNGYVKAVNHGMVKIPGGAIFTGLGTND
jgi:hypothetical protein